ncbi:hypothetical protein ABMA28_015166 [Loxostege sticticalis]|uniref:Multiple inositol polyphosphate phosphatase 1 n=1 Tax=Loxostege sticticalis TaxID=481309 RepID=A0ABD0TEG7_LOXSC
MGWSLLALFALVTLGFAYETCLSREKNPYLFFGTKTSYIVASRGGPNHTKVHEVPACEPVAFWMLYRHESYEPEEDEIRRLQVLNDFKKDVVSNYRRSIYNKTNHRICLPDYQLIETWEWKPPRHNLTFAGDTSSEEFIDALKLAQNWRQRYPNLFTENRRNYKFKYMMDDRRSTTSLGGLTRGLFNKSVVYDGFLSEHDNKLLRPHKFCEAWTKSVGDTPIQLRLFEAKQEYKEMIRNVSLRLGFNYDISADAIRIIFDMCRYDKAWDISKVSPWCAVFTRDDLRRLEYAEDLETYYNYGHGNELNAKVGCVFVKDMMNFFTSHVGNEPPQKPQVMLQFTEAPALLLTLAAMGAHKDPVHLEGHNYHSAPMQARKWSSSKMAPFNANLAAVLYRCRLNGSYQHKVLLLLNEKPISLDWCTSGVCEWSQFVIKLGEVANSCDLEACNETHIGRNVAILVVAVAFIFLAAVVAALWCRSILNRGKISK